MGQPEQLNGELAAAAQAMEEYLSPRRAARLDAIRKRVDRAPGAQWYTFDARSRPGGAIQLLSTGLPCPREHLADVLPQGADPDATADLVVNALADLRWLLEEVERLQHRVREQQHG